MNETTENIEDLTLNPNNQDLNKQTNTEVANEEVSLISNTNEPVSQELSIEPRVINQEDEVVSETAVNNTENSTEELSIEPRAVGEENTESGQTEIQGEVVSDTNTETTSTTTPTPTSTMSIPFIGLSVLQCVVAFLLIVVVLQQSKTASSMTSSGMSGGDSQSYWNQNKGRSKESQLAKMTVILGIVFFIITVSLGFIK